MAADIESARPEDFDAISALLRQHQLPLDGLRDHLATTLVVRQGREIVGSVALEVYADGAVMRSVAVAPAMQGQRVGHGLTNAALDLAREVGAPAVFLLTTTAERFFPKFGFERIERDEVPASVRTSVEFTSACPATATVMRKRM